MRLLKWQRQVTAQKIASVDLAVFGALTTLFRLKIQPLAVSRRAVGMVADSEVKLGDFEAVERADALRGKILHVDDLDASESVKGREPQELLLLRPREEEELAVLGGEREREFPLASHFAFLCVLLVFLHRLDVENVVEIDFFDLLCDLFLLDLERAMLFAEQEEPFVVERRRKELDFLRHFKQHALHFICAMLGQANTKREPTRVETVLTCKVGE